MRGAVREARGSGRHLQGLRRDLPPLRRLAAWLEGRGPVRRVQAQLRSGFVRPGPDAPGARGYDAMVDAFHRRDLVIRVSGDTLTLCPALIVSPDEIGELVERTRAVIRAVA